MCDVYIEGDSVEIKTEADSNDMIMHCVCLYSDKLSCRIVNPLTSLNSATLAFS